MKKFNITLTICLFALTSSMVATDVVTIDNFSIIPGETKNVNISLANESEYVAFQFDLYLPDSLTVESYSADRSRIPESTTLSMTRQQDGSYRFITMAINGDPITGTSGPIVNISVRAHDEMAFGESTGYFRKVKLSRSNATGPTYNEISFPVTLERPRFAIRYLVDGEINHVDSVGYGLTITPLAALTKVGYMFSGWSDIPSTMPANDVEVTGSFTVNKYILTYKVDGEDYKKDTLAYNTTITPLTALTRVGYTFSGWSDIPATMPANDVEVTGSFTVNKYILTYKVDGADYKKDTLAYNTTITPLTALTRVGYTFSGWSDIPATMPANDVEVTGSFTVNKYILTYKVDDEDYKKDTLVYNAAITPLAALTKVGYTFSGWSDIPATMPANDVEVTGSFTVNKYILTYKVDGADYKKDTLVYNAAITPLAALTRVGYTFSGWSDIPATMPANDVEVTGSFTVNKYILTYKVDGADYKKDTLVYNAAITPLAALTKVGYTFSGWSDIPATMPANDVEVTGSFTVNKYILTYKVDGEDYKKDTLAYNAAITPLAALSKEGYTFSGWSDIPATMPADDVVVIGSFTVNKYLLSVLIDGVVVYSDSIAYGTRLADYVDLIKEKGIDITQWEWYSQIETITMPAHDVVINAVLDSIKPIRRDADENAIYDLTGKKIVTDDISTLPSGIYIRNGRKFMVK